MIFCDFPTLLNNHPFHTIAYQGMGGEVELYMNDDVETCTIELSYAMNKSGLWIPDDLPHSPLVHTGRVRSKKDASGNNYIYSVVDMIAYLNSTYPVAENYHAANRAGYAKKLGSRVGIIALGYRHISLWDGSHYVHEEQFFDIWSGKYGASATKRGIFFWEVKSFASFLNDIYHFE